MILKLNKTSYSLINFLSAHDNSKYIINFQMTLIKALNLPTNFMLTHNF